MRTIIDIPSPSKHYCSPLFITTRNHLLPLPTTPTAEHHLSLSTDPLFFAPSDHTIHSIIPIPPSVCLPQCLAYSLLPPVKTSNGGSILYSTCDHREKHHHHHSSTNNHLPFNSETPCYRAPTHPSFPMHESLSLSTFTPVSSRGLPHAHRYMPLRCRAPASDQPPFLSTIANHCRPPLFWPSPHPPLTSWRLDLTGTSTL